MTSILGRSKESMGKSNRRLILSEIVLKGPITRSKLSKNTGLTGASVSRITRNLISAGLIVEKEALAQENRPGRPFIELGVNPDGGYVIGLVLNAYEQLVILTNLHNKVLESRTLPIKDLSDSSAVLAIAVREIKGMISISGVDDSKILGLCAAVTGAVDINQGVVVSSPTMTWEDVPLRKTLLRDFEFPIHLENLPNSINLAEHRFGITKGSANVLLINVALRLGASLLVDNKLIRGGAQFTGLLGDVRIHHSGIDVGSGKELKLDDISSGSAIIRQYQEVKGLDEEVAYSAEASQAFRSIIKLDGKDEHVSEILSNAGVVLGRILETAVSVVPTDKLVIAGLLVASPSYINGISKVLKSASSVASNVELVVSDMPYETAARWIAINEFLVARDLDIESLIQAEDS